MDRAQFPLLRYVFAFCGTFRELTTLPQLRTALGKQGDAAAVNKIMERADVNGDGEISYDEYYRLMNMDKFGDAAVFFIFHTRFFT